MPHCDTCGRSVQHVALFRANPKGETPAVWRCRDCDPLIAHPDVEDLVDVIEGAIKPGGPE